MSEFYNVFYEKNCFSYGKFAYLVFFLYLCMPNMCNCTNRIQMKHLSLHMILLLLLLTAMPMHGQQVTEEVAVEPADSLIAQDTDSALLALVDSLPPIELVYPQILLDLPNVRVEQDSLITLLMEEKFAGVERGEHERPGYRVQVYSNNHPLRGKSEALQIEQRVKQATNVPVYVIYASPSWKVRLGDFLTEQQAATFRDAFKVLFPDLADYTYIVRDQVKVR